MGRDSAALPVRYLVRAAVAAPSVHNSQPWRFRAGSDTIEILADPRRMLRFCDPRGQELSISCGAALFNLRLAATVLGRKPVVALLPRAEEPLLLASVRLGGRRRPSVGEWELFRAIPDRRTNRNPFGERVIPESLQTDLCDAALLESTALHMLDRATAERLLELVSDADHALESDPHYRADLAEWTTWRRPGSGVPRSAIGAKPAGRNLPLRDFGFAWPSCERPLRCFEGLPHLALLATSADEPIDWLRAGQALQRILLLATVHGVSASLFTQALEFPLFDREPRDEFVWARYPQVLLRLGYGPPAVPTPRRPLSDVVDEG